MIGKLFGRGGLGPPGYLALTFLLAACGRDLSTESRIHQSTKLLHGIDGAGYVDSEDIIAIMGAPDKTPTQNVTEEEQILRVSSLIPLDQFKPAGEPLLINDLALSLQTEFADAREITDLRTFDTPVRNQGSRPWCTAFATIGAMENLAQRIYGVSLDLSEIHHFNSYRVYQTAPSLNAARKVGLIDEDLWPYYGKKQSGSESKIRSRLSESKKIQMTLSDVVESIRDQRPVVINLTVNSSFMSPKVGGIIVPGGLQQGGHAIALTGVVLDQRVGGGGYFIIKNSWGSSWGNKGYGYVPFSYCKYSSCFAWSVGDMDVLDDAGRPKNRLLVPVPAPTPGISPITGDNLLDPKPLPSDISAGNFKLVSQVKDYRGLLGAYFYTLTLTADQQALNKINSVTYKVDGYRDFTASVSPNNANLTSQDIASRSYKIWPGQSERIDALVSLKDGREFEIRGINVGF